MKNVTKDLIAKGDYDITYQDIATFVWIAILLTSVAMIKWCFIVLFKKNK